MCLPSFGVVSYVLTHDCRRAFSLNAADESKPSALEEEALAHTATEDSVFLKRFIPQNCGEVLNLEQEVESRDHRVEGNLRLGVVGSERVHTAPKDGVNETMSEEGEGGAVGKARRGMRGHADATTPRGHLHEDREVREVRYTLHHHGDH